MPLNSYFKDELSFLRELGSEFSEKYPALAPYLAKSSADPDVERLLEGFAFVGGRIREKLDDEFPEIITNLLNVLAPQLLRPFPSASILEFRPLANRMAAAQSVPRDVVVQSEPIGGTACSFRTCGEVKIHPILLKEAVIDPAGTHLMLSFEAFGGMPSSSLKIDHLRIYLSGDPSFDLFRWLSVLVRQCRVVFPEKPSRPDILLPKPLPGGFEQDYALVPAPATSFQGYRLLQEYLIFPEKFLFIDFPGLDALSETSTLSSRFSIECEFKQEVPRSWRLSAENFRLNCIPIVNLFDAESNPVDVTHERREYRLTPTTTDTEIYSVRTATAWIYGTSQAKRYEPFLSLEQDPQITHYGVQTKAGIDEETRHTYVSLTPLTAESLPPPRETAVFSLLCTNGTVAAQLKPGEINRPSDNSPQYARFENVSKVSAYAPVTLASDRAWLLLSSLVLSPSTLNDVSAFRSVLRLYNCPEKIDGRLSRANTKRIEGIKGLEATPANFVITPELDPDRKFRRRYGLPIRGTAVHLTVEGANFSDEGDLYLFGAILNRFFSQYTTLNSMTQLQLTDMSSGAEYSWQPRLGEQIEF